MNKEPLRSALFASHFFAQARPSLLGPLIEQAHLVLLRAQQHVFLAGDVTHCFYWLESGAVTLYSPGLTGEEKIFRVVRAGALLAETMMYLQPCRYPLSAQASTDCRLYCMPRQALLTLTRQCPDMAFSLVQTLACRMTQAVKHIDLLTLGNSRQRLVGYLLDMHAQQDGGYLQLPASQQTIARQLNISPETFSRHLALLKHQGLVGQRRSRELILLDTEGLCRAAGLPPQHLQHLQRHAPCAFSHSLHERYLF